MATLLKDHKQIWLFDSKSKVEKLCQVAKLKNRRPNVADYKEFGFVVDIQTVKDLADFTLEDVTEEFHLYRNIRQPKGKTKDKCVIRKVASSFVHWKNRTVYGKMHEIAFYRQDVTVLNHYDVFGADVLETDENNQLEIQDVSSWGKDTFEKEYFRRSGLGDLMESLDAQIAKIDKESQEFDKKKAEKAA